MGCGDAVFLEAMGERLKADHPKPFSSPDALARALTGVEVKPESARAAIRRLNRRFGSPGLGWDIRTADALGLAENERFDAVVGNPPWVRLQDLGHQQRDWFRRSFTSASGHFDLSYLFIEKAIRMVRPGGLVVLVVPRGVRTQPAGHALREYLTANGTWTIEEVPPNLFRTPAGVDAGVLLFRKSWVAKDTLGISNKKPVPDRIEVTSGVATGADHVFLVDESTIETHRIEQQATLPALRGRDIGRHEQSPTCLPKRIIWPYVWIEGQWSLANFEQWPAANEYLLQHRNLLETRPRLSAAIRKAPDQWARFIDARRHRPDIQGVRFVVPDIFREPAYARIEDPTVVTMNTAFEIRPSASMEKQVEATLKDPAFWCSLAERSRRLGSGYRRSSVVEWRVALEESIMV